MIFVECVRTHFCLSQLESLDHSTARVLVSGSEARFRYTHQSFHILPPLPRRLCQRPPHSLPHALLFICIHDFLYPVVIPPRRLLPLHDHSCMSLPASITRLGIVEKLFCYLIPLIFPVVLDQDIIHGLCPRSPRGVTVGVGASHGARVNLYLLHSGSPGDMWPD